MILSYHKSELMSTVVWPGDSRSNAQGRRSHPQWIRYIL